MGRACESVKEGDMGPMMQQTNIYLRLPVAMQNRCSTRGNNMSVLQQHEVSQAVCPSQMLKSNSRTMHACTCSHKCGIHRHTPAHPLLKQPVTVDLKGAITAWFIPKQSNLFSREGVLKRGSYSQPTDSDNEARIENLPKAQHFAWCLVIYEKSSRE